MADKLREITIVATVNDSKPHGIGFEKQNKGGGEADLTFNKDKDGMTKSHHYRLVFTLINGEGANLRFVDDRDNAMWAIKSPGPADPPCPKAPSTAQGFFATQVSATELTVRNNDHDQSRIAFTLNFIKPGGNDHDPTDYVPYDPIVINQNGGVKRSYTAALVVVVTVVAVGGIATKLLGLW